MHKRLADLDAVMSFVAQGQLRDAAKLLENGMARHGNHPPGAPQPGQYVPAEFRALDQVARKSAGELAKALADAAPTAANYAAIFKAMSGLTATCSGCHGVYRTH